MRLFAASLLLTLAITTLFSNGRVRAAPGEDEFVELLERLRKDNPGEHDKVVALAKTDRSAAIRFLRERYSTKGDKPTSKTKPERDPSKPAVTPARRERFAVIDTLQVGDFSIDLCRREDGAFGLGEIRKGKLPLRRADSLITWQVDGKFPRYERRRESMISLRDPPATLTIQP